MQAAELVLTPYTSVLTPKPAEAPWAPQDPIREEAAEVERYRQRGNSAKTAFLNTAQLALHYLRYGVAGGIVGPWGLSGRDGSYANQFSSPIGAFRCPEYGNGVAS